MNILHLGSGCPDALLQSLESAKRFGDVFEQSRALSWHAECQVTVARIKASGQQVAVKTYDTGKLKEASLLQVQMEALIHSSLSHPHIVRMFVALQDARHIYIVLEYAEGGDLRRHLGAPTERRVREFIAAPLLQALVLLHEEGVVHRDLKPDNVLVQDSHVLLADFGLAMYSSTGSAVFNQEATEQAVACEVLADSASGTPLYTAPEVLLAMFKSQPMAAVVQPKNDVWALGVMVLEALTGCHPFSPENCSSYNGNVLYTIAHHKAVALPMDLSPELRDFLSQSLQRDPELRPTAEELLQHPWLVGGARRDASGHCRALSAEIEGNEHLFSESCTPEACTPESGGLSPFDMAADSTPTKIVPRPSKVQHLATPQHHMHRAYSAFEMLDCWES